MDTSKARALIEITRRFTSWNREAIRKARNEKIRCVRLEPNLYYAARREAGHGRYLISFFQKRGSWWATCSTIRGDPCPSTAGKRCCIHIAISYLRALESSRRENGNGNQASDQNSQGQH